MWFNKKIIISFIIVCLLFNTNVLKIESIDGKSNNFPIFKHCQDLPKPPTSCISPFRHIIGSNDEGSHDRNDSYHQEWWYYIAFFNLEDSELKNWSMMVSFNQMGLTDILFCVIFDEEKSSYGGVTNKFKGVLKASKKDVDIKFLNSSVKGKYPEWDIYAEYKIPNKMEVTVNVTYKAISLPMWLFMNMGHNRSKSHIGHYCIIESDVNGTVKINETTYKVHGLGYHEHSWINVEQQNSTEQSSLPQNNIKEDVPEWQLLLDVWDWGSIFLDNGWNIFIAKICQQSKLSKMLPGSLWITPDGENATECRYFKLEYLETKETSIPTIKIPIKIHIKAMFFNVFIRHPNEGLIRLDLYIEVKNLREFIWDGLDFSAGVWEAPCKVHGTLEWGKNSIELNGCAMLELTRAAKTDNN